MSQAFVNENQARAVCCWNAPDLPTIEALFAQAGVATASVEEVIEYGGV